MYIDGFVVDYKGFSYNNMSGKRSNTISYTMVAIKGKLITNSWNKSLINYCHFMTVHPTIMEFTSAPSPYMH